MNDGPNAANTDPRVNLDDARALIARARKHFADFNALLFPHEGQGLWQTTERRDQRTGEFFYRLHMDRQRLIDAKPIIADSATNIASALDHVAAAIAKVNGHGRLTKLYFPWGFTDEAFDRALAKVEPVLGTEMAGVLADARGRTGTMFTTSKRPSRFQTPGNTGRCCLRLALRTASRCMYRVKGSGYSKFRQTLSTTPTPLNIIVERSAYPEFPSASWSV